MSQPHPARWSRGRSNREKALTPKENKILGVLLKFRYLPERHVLVCSRTSRGRRSRALGRSGSSANPNLTPDQPRPGPSLWKHAMEEVGRRWPVVLARHTELPSFFCTRQHLPAPLSSQTAPGCQTALNAPLAWPCLANSILKRSQWAVRSRPPTRDASYQNKGPHHARLPQLRPSHVSCPWGRKGRRLPTNGSNAGDPRTNHCPLLPWRSRMLTMHLRPHAHVVGPTRRTSSSVDHHFQAHASMGPTGCVPCY